MCIYIYIYIPLNPSDPRCGDAAKLSRDTY